MADDSRYGLLEKRLYNDFVLGNNDYPIDVAEVPRILKNFSKEMMKGSRELPPLSPKHTAPDPMPTPGVDLCTAQG